MCSKNSNKSKHGFCKLHYGVMYNSLKIVDEALHRYKRQLLDCELHKWGTPLLTSLRRRTDYKIIKRLIEVGSNPNVSYGRAGTPLHHAIVDQNLTHNLIKRGADVNARNKQNLTPLHHAIQFGSLEVICMLLYYGAEVDVKEGTQLAFAFVWKRIDAVNVLIDYYDFLDDDDDDDANIFLHDTFTFSYVLEYNDGDLFRLVWPKFSYDAIQELHPSFLFLFLKTCHFETSIWVEHLRSIITSEFALELINNYSVCTCTVLHCSFIHDLVCEFKERNVGEADRITLIYIVCSLGVELCSEVFNSLVRYYGCNAEFHALLYCGGYKINLCNRILIEPSLITFLLVQEIDFSEETIGNFFLSQTKLLLDDNSGRDDVLKELGYFSLPAIMREVIFNYYRMYERQRIDTIVPVLKRKFMRIPEFPSLVELSRNELRTYIKEVYFIKSPYQFYDVVKRLGLPKAITDLILFKMPLYY